MIILKGEKVYLEQKVVMRDLSDFKDKDILDLLISTLISLEKETGEPYRLVRMQQRIMEVYGIFPEKYNPSDRATLVLGRYSIDDLRTLR